MKCSICEFIRASTRDRLLFLRDIIYGRELAVILSGITLSFIAFLVTKRADQAGCSLVVMALAVAAWNRFNEEFWVSQQRLNKRTMEMDNSATDFLNEISVGPVWAGKGGELQPTTRNEIANEVKKKHEDMKAKTDQTFNSRQYQIAEFVLAIVGTILWGFGAAS